MADTNKPEGPSPFSPDAFAIEQLPDHDTVFISQKDLDAFEHALNDPGAPALTALNDWRPVNQRVRQRSGGKGGKRKRKIRKDETREGFVYTLLRWPLLLLVGGWLLVLSLLYLLTRFYIWSYEKISTAWRGQREQLLRQLQSSSTLDEWRTVARQLDKHLHNDAWKEEPSSGFYDSVTIQKAFNQLRASRERAEQMIKSSAAGQNHDERKEQALHELTTLVEACVKSNFAGIFGPRLYSETFLGTKNLIQEYTDELESCLAFLMQDPKGISAYEKSEVARRMDRNFGRTALCLSGGATRAYLHYGVAKAMLDQDLLPDIITGTSGGALVAALLGTRTDSELRRLLTPSLAFKITACEEGLAVRIRRLWSTGALFDTIQWAEKCSWFCRGSMTFKEAYERTGRILNVSCIPSDRFSPAILANYITTPHCVIWSAVLASAAVPGILNPVVLMMKTRDGTLAPYSFGHKWKDGSLRTDIPIRALNMHFNVNFPVVSQVNPHINLFLNFSSRGAPGTPVTHRKGRGWEGGFAGSAIIKYLILDMTKWLRFLRHLELLPRWFGQDWSNLFLQTTFSGSITILPRTKLSDLYYILSDPTPLRLRDYFHTAQLSTFPKLLFLENHMKIEKLIKRGLSAGQKSGIRERSSDRGDAERSHLTSEVGELSAEEDASLIAASSSDERTRRGSMIQELKRQSGVFFDDPLTDYDTDRSVNGRSTVNEAVERDDTIQEACNE